jgi:hypothetical protein
MASKPVPSNVNPAICIELRPIDDDAHLLPRRRRHPQYLPLHTPLPRVGELLYLSSTSAWGVKGVLHEWIAPDRLNITVLIQYLGGSHHGDRPDFPVTQ